MIERAYQVGEALGLAVWGMDEAGPYTTTPYPGMSWQLQTHPKRYPHDYQRHGTAKILTLFHPATGQVRVKGVTSATNPVWHGWLKTELTAILADLPEPKPMSDEGANRAYWECWRVGVSVKPTLLSANLPPLRMLLTMDNLAGHRTPEIVLGLFRQGILPLYTPRAGSWLNMTESIQRILKRRALDGQYPTSPTLLLPGSKPPPAAGMRTRRPLSGLASVNSVASGLMRAAIRWPVQRRLPSALVVSQPPFTLDWPDLPYTICALTHSSL